MIQLKLYRRENGEYGIRNRIAVISTVACANHIAEQIAASVDIADAYTHPYGCDQLGEDLALSQGCLVKMGIHPNAGAVLVVGLGCEEIKSAEIAEEVKKSKKPVKYFNIQQIGGTSKSVKYGTEICKDFEKTLKDQVRVNAPLSVLTIGLECGGSDFTSGIAANPALGVMTKKMCEHGVKVIFGETTELMGAENIFENLCSEKRFSDFIKNRICRIEKMAFDMHVDLRGAQPSPGNIEGGLSTIEEKSLGSICKIGSTKIIGTLNFGETPQKSGLHFMDTPGNDLACTLGLAAGGSQIIFFTTGRGTPMGFAAAPVIKITANKRTAEIMKENIDINLSAIIEGRLDLEKAGNVLFEAAVETADGRETAAEKSGHREFSLYRISPALT